MQGVWLHAVMEGRGGERERGQSLSICLRTTLSALSRFVYATIFIAARMIYQNLAITSLFTPMRFFVV
jgi:hypothetical protein